jgi:DNA-directed RNA polymerase subunit RPC12/RpoP
MNVIKFSRCPFTAEISKTKDSECPWDTPNCPNCRSRKVRQAYYRETTCFDGKKKRNYPHDAGDYKCMSCKALFQWVAADQQGIPNSSVVKIDEFQEDGVKISN